MGAVVTKRRRLLRLYLGIDEASFCDQRRLSPRVTTPALIVSQWTRHLVAKSRYPGKINTNKTDIAADGTPRCVPTMGGRDGLFFPNLVLLVPGTWYVLQYSSINIRLWKHTWYSYQNP